MMVSVVIPCRNAEPWIGDAVRSALQEGCAEIVLVDDGSTDRSNERAIEAGRERLRVVRGNGGGVSAARSIGTAATTQPFVQYLDADDLLGEGKIARQLEVAARTGADVVYGDFQELCEIRPGVFEPGRVWRTDLSGDTSARVFGWSQFIQIGAMLFRRTALDRVGGSDPAMRHIEDVNLYLRLALAGATFVHEPGPEIAVWHRKHQSVVSLGASDRSGFHAGCLRNIMLAHDAWKSSAEGLTAERKAALLGDYEFLARFYFEHDRAVFREIMARVRALEPGFVPTAPPMLRRLSSIIGYERAEAVALRYRAVKAAVGRATGRRSRDLWGQPSIRRQSAGESP
jgi:glycosyltransferase involved in cell wall biosynthesis